MNKYVQVRMKCIFTAEYRCLHVKICDRRFKTELYKKLGKLGLQPKREIMNITIPSKKSIIGGKAITSLQFLTEP